MLAGAQRDLATRQPGAVLRAVVPVPIDAHQAESRSCARAAGPGPEGLELLPLLREADALRAHVPMAVVARVRAGEAHREPGHVEAPVLLVLLDGLHGRAEDLFRLQGLVHARVAEAESPGDLTAREPLRRVQLHDERTLRGLAPVFALRPRVVRARKRSLGQRGRGDRQLRREAPVQAAGERFPRHAAQRILAPGRDALRDAEGGHPACVVRRVAFGPTPAQLRRWDPLAVGRREILRLVPQGERDAGAIAAGSCPALEGLEGAPLLGDRDPAPTVQRVARVSGARAARAHLAPNGVQPASDQALVPACPWTALRSHPHQRRADGHRAVAERARDPGVRPAFFFVEPQRLGPGHLGARWRIHDCRRSFTRAPRPARFLDPVVERVPTSLPPAPSLHGCVMLTRLAAWIRAGPFHGQRLRPSTPEGTCATSEGSA